MEAKMNYYTITCGDFASQTTENIELISVVGEVIYLQTTQKLSKPYTKISTLPDAIKVEWDGRVSDAKKSKCEAVCSAKKAKINEAFIIGSHNFDLNDDTKLNLLLANFGKNTSWITKEGEIVEFTADEVSAAIVKFAENIETIIRNTQAKQSEIMQTMSLEAVCKIDTTL